MQTISIRELKETIAHVVFVEREPLMIWGQPGVGKSKAVEQVCLTMNAIFIDIRLSQYDSVDMRGVPDVQDGQTKWNPPATMPFKGNPAFDENAPFIVVFFDEINSAQPSVSAVAYQIVNDRRCGEHVLMDNVVIIAAGNREGDKGIVNKMPTPLANRFTHVEVGLDVESWVDYAVDAGLSPVGIGFIQFRKALLSTFMVQKQGEEKPSVTLNKAFATPRTWEKALGYFASKTMPENIQRIAMAGAVGSAESEEFWGFVAIYSQIKNLIPAILRDPGKVDIPAKTDVVYALVIALSGEMKVSNVKALYTFIKRLDAEFVVLAWQLALKRDQSLFGVPEFLDFSNEYKKVFKP